MVPSFLLPLKTGSSPVSASPDSDPASAWPFTVSGMSPGMAAPGVWSPPPGWLLFSLPCPSSLLVHWFLPGPMACSYLGLLPPATLCTLPCLLQTSLCLPSGDRATGLPAAVKADRKGLSHSSPCWLFQPPFPLVPSTHPVLQQEDEVVRLLRQPGLSSARLGPRSQPL